MIRRGFIRKVYGTVAAQLVLTTIIAAPIATASKGWLHAHSALLLLSLYGSIATVLAMFCCQETILKKHPINLIFLAVFTILEAVSVGFYCASYEMQSVLWCALATGVITGSLTLFSLTTKVDVTSCGGYLAGTSMGLFVLGLIGWWCHAPLLQFMYACGGAALASAYIVYDTQLVAGGKHQTKRFGVDDYIPAAMALYMDIVRLFLFLLRLFGEKKREQ